MIKGEKKDKELMLVKQEQILEDIKENLEEIIKREKRERVVVVQK